MNLEGKSQKWKIVENNVVYEAEPWIQVSIQHIRLPSGKLVYDFHQVKMPESSVVVAKTPDGRMIMIKQYKHGVREVSLTLPGGLIEEEEEPLVAAKRELLEETGYIADNWQSLGCFVANANYGCGNVHVFLAQNSKCVKEPNSGDLENMEILLMNHEEAVNAIHRQEIVVLSTVAAISLGSLT